MYPVMPSEHHQVFHVCLCALILLVCCGLVRSQCDKSVCSPTLNRCNCRNETNPHGLPVEKLPQMVLLTFSGNVRDLNWCKIRKIFYQKKNHNQCQAVGTFFIADRATKFCLVNHLDYDGHEIGSFGSGHKSTDAIRSLDDKLQGSAKVKRNDITGWRSENIVQSSDEELDMAFVQLGYQYDSTIRQKDPGLVYWPYTLNNDTHYCMTGPCEVSAYSRKWVIPISPLLDEKGRLCDPNIVFCDEQPKTPDEIFNVLWKNLERHLKAERAPFVIDIPTNFFLLPEAADGISKFVDEVLKRQEIWLVTGQQLLAWMMDPDYTNLYAAQEYEKWNCKEGHTKMKCENSECVGMETAMTQKRNITSFEKLIGNSPAVLYIQLITLTVIAIALIIHDKYFV